MLTTIKRRVFQSLANLFDGIGWAIDKRLFMRSDYSRPFTRVERIALAISDRATSAAWWCDRRAYPSYYQHNDTKFGSQYDEFDYYDDAEWDALMDRIERDRDAAPVA